MHAIYPSQEACAKLFLLLFEHQTRTKNMKALKARKLHAVFESTCKAQSLNAISCAVGDSFLRDLRREGFKTLKSQDPTLDSWIFLVWKSACGAGSRVEAKGFRRTAKVV